jgi:antitoxin (DNA-binding transcriptional repressor) of toxin-antitoxin stability system
MYARILYMTTVPVDEARQNFSALVDEAVTTNQRVLVTRNGRLRLAGHRYRPPHHRPGAQPWRLGHADYHEALQRLPPGGVSR